MTELFTHQDLLHPDTINLLVMTCIGKSDSPILVDWDKRESEWTAFIPSPDIKGYCQSPIMRRIRKANGQWRHFPMKTPTIGPTHEAETAGWRMDNFRPKDCGTWYATSLWSIDGGDAVKSRLLRYSQALAALAALPGLSPLISYASSLQLVVSSPYTRSSRVDEVITESVIAIRLLCPSAKPGDVLGPDKSRQFPSLNRLVSLTDSIESLIQGTICFSDDASLTQSGLDRIKNSFNLNRSAFVGGDDGKSLNELNSWKGRAAVKMELKDN